MLAAIAVEGEQVVQRVRLVAVVAIERHGLNPEKTETPVRLGGRSGIVPEGEQSIGGLEPVSSDDDTEASRRTGFRPLQDRAGIDRAETVDVGTETDSIPGDTRRFRIYQGATTNCHHHDGSSRVKGRADLRSDRPGSGGDRETSGDSQRQRAVKIHPGCGRSCRGQGVGVYCGSGHLHSETKTRRDSRTNRIHGSGCRHVPSYRYNGKNRSMVPDGAV